jgi:hypothetical protein
LKSDRPVVGGRRWSGRGASQWGGGPVWRPKRGEELTRKLLYGGEDQRRGRDGGKPE